MFRKADQAERREVNRYKAIGAITLGWREASEFRAVSATLLDISQNGARLETPQAPRDGAAVWLLLGDEKHDQWVSGTVVAVHRGWRGPYTVRLQFKEGCPYDFFRDAIHGVTMQSEVEVPKVEELRDRHLWY